VREALVIGCGKQKIWSKKPWLGTVPAREAYISGLFRLCRSYAEEHYPDDWFILSAHYGLIQPGSHISNYDSTFWRSDRSRVSLETLRKQCALLLAGYDTVASLAGAAYNECIKHALGPDQLLRMPLASMGLFERMKWLKLETSGTTERR
jgi:hypothetical protein